MGLSSSLLLGQYHLFSTQAEWCFSYPDRKKNLNWGLGDRAVLVVPFDVLVFTMYQYKEFPLRTFFK